MTQKEAIAKAPSGRVRRSPLTNKGKFHIGRKDPDYVYRYVNDEGDNVQDRIEQGYEVVLNSETQVGDKRVDAATSEGSARTVTVGHGKKAVLMKIPKEFYEQDQAAKQGYVDETERATKQDALSDNRYGKIEITRK